MFSVRRTVKVDESGNNAWIVGLRTAQLISPAAKTCGVVLHVRVSLRPLWFETMLLLVFPPAATNELWHIVGALHTLQPVPAHPLEHAHDEEETLPNDVAEAPEMRGRCVPWSMLPPQAGAEHVAPPNPGGHEHAEELIGTP